LLRAIRLIARITLVALWTGGMFVVLLVVMPLGIVSKPLLVRCRQFLFRVWGRCLAVIIGMRVTVRGRPPEPPFFMVSNHVSHVDAYLLVSLLGCTFVAKSEVASWPVVGYMVKHAGIIFVKREKRSDTLRVSERIAEALDLGEGVVMFAESTTSRGREIRPFKTALFEPAIRAKCPMHYATIHYATDDGLAPASEWVCWWDGRPYSYGRHVLRLLAQPGFAATVTFGEAPVSAPDRKILAQKLWEAAMKQFTPIE